MNECEEGKMSSFDDVLGNSMASIAYCEAVGLRCPFCKRFSCQYYRPYVTPEHKEYLDKNAVDPLDLALKKMKKKYCFLITRKRANAYLKNETAEQLQNLSGKKDEILYKALPFCYYLQIESLYGEKCNKCNHTPCLFYELIPSMALKADTMRQCNHLPGRELCKFLLLEFQEQLGVNPRNPYSKVFLPTCVSQMIGKVYSNFNFPTIQKGRKRKMTNQSLV